MNKKDFLYNEINFLEEYNRNRYIYAKLHDVFCDFREKLKKINTDDEYIELIRTIDEYNVSSELEKKFCKRYKLNYSGLMSTHLIIKCDDMTSVYKTVSSLEYDTDQKYFIINGIRKIEMSLIYYKKIKMEFDDKICVVTDNKSAMEVIKHYKEILVKIKKQELENDFIS